MEAMQQEYREILRDYEEKRYHIVGVGRSGVGIANLLGKLGAHVSISDMKKREEVGIYIDRLDEGIRVFAGRQDSDLVSGIDSLVLSPGVPQDTHVVSAARLKGIEVVGEIELSYRIITTITERAGRGVRWFGITGTNGKSTTATLLYEMLKKGNRQCVLSGNIGYPLSDVGATVLEGQVAAAGEMDIVLELSSFQLELLRDFRLDNCALLNISADHLDRYADLDHYVEAKAGIFHNQRISDTAVINADDELSLRVSEKSSAKKYFISSLKEVEGAFAKSGSIFINHHGKKEKLMAISDIRIAGVHNLYNSLAALLMASLAGMPGNVIVSTLKEFPGLEHRLEFVGEVGGVSFFNDSKGTNVGAVMKSLESFDSNVVLIAGGRDKNGDFAALIPYVRDRVKKIVVIGEASGKIEDALGKTVPVERAVTLWDAVSLAFAGAEHGGTVLFSPACASFDMFRDFEDRGRQFKQITKELMRDQS